MPIGINEILDSDLEVSSETLKNKPVDLRARHCKTAKELDLWKFSSSYQTLKGGLCDLQTETGIDAVKSSGSSSSLSMYD